MGKLWWLSLIVAWSCVELSYEASLKDRCDKTVTASLNQPKILAHYYRGACYVLDGVVKKPFDQIQCNHFPESGHPAFAQGRQILERLYEKFKPTWASVGIDAFAFIGLKATPFTSSANKSAERDNFYWWASDQVKWKAPEFAVKWSIAEPGGSGDNCGHMWNAYTQVFGYPCTASIAYVCEYRDSSIEYGKFYEPVRGISSQTIREQASTNQTTCASLCTKSLACQSYTHSRNGLCALHYLPARELTTVKLEGASIYDILNVDENCDSKLLFEAPAAEYTPPLPSQDTNAVIGGNAALMCQVDHCPGTTSTEDDTETTTCTNKGWNPLAFSRCELRYRCNKAITASLNKTKVLAHYHRGSCYVLDDNTPQTIDQMHCNHFPERGYPALIPGKKILKRLYEVFNPKWPGIQDFAYIGLRAPKFTSTATYSLMREEFYWWVSHREQWKAPEFAVNWYISEPGSSDLCGHMYRTTKDVWGYPCGERIASMCEYRDQESIDYNLYLTGFNGSSDEVVSEQSATDVAGCLNQCKQVPICQSFSYDSATGICALYFLPASELKTQQSEGVRIYDTLDYNCECDPEELEAPSASYSAIRTDGKMDLGQTATLNCKKDHCPNSNEVVATKSSTCTKRGWNPLSISTTCDLKYRCHKTITSSLNQTKILAHYYRGSCFVLDGSDNKPFDKIRCNHLPEKGYLAPLPGKRIVQTLYDLFNPGWSAQGIHDFAYIGLNAKPYTWSGSRSDMWENYNWYASNQEQWKAPGSSVKWASTEPGDANDLCGHLWRTQEYIYGYPCSASIASMCEYRDYESIKYRPYLQGVRGSSSQTVSEHTTQDATKCGELCTQQPICQSYTFNPEDSFCALHFLPAVELGTTTLESGTLFDIVEYGCECDPALLKAPTATFSAIRKDGKVNAGEKATISCGVDDCGGTTSESHSSTCTNEGWDPPSMPLCSTDGKTIKSRCDKSITASLDQQKVLAHHYRGACYVLDGVVNKPFDQIQCNHFPESGYPAFSQGKQILARLYEKFKPDWVSVGIHAFAFIGLKATPFTSGTKSAERDNFYWWASDQAKWKAPEFAVKWSSAEPGGSGDNCGHLWNAYTEVFGYPCSAAIAYMCEYRDANSITFRPFLNGFSGSANQQIKQQVADVTECGNICANALTCQSYTHVKDSNVCILHFLTARDLVTEQMEKATIYDILDNQCFCEPKLLQAPTATYTATRTDGNINRGQTATLSCKADHCPNSEEVARPSATCTASGWSPLMLPLCDLKYRCNKAITDKLNKTKILAHYHRGSCYVLDGNDMMPFEQIRCNHLPERGYLAPLPGRMLAKKLYDVFNPIWPGIHDFAYIGMKAPKFTSTATYSLMREEFYWRVSNQEQWKAPEFAVDWYASEPGSGDLCGHMYRTTKNIWGYPCGERIASICEYRDRSIEYGIFFKGFQGYEEQIISEHTTADVQGCSNLCQQVAICQSFLYVKETGNCALYFLPAIELSTKQLKGAEIYDTLDHGCNCKSEDLLAPSASFSAVNTDGSVDLGETAVLTCKPDHCDQADGEEFFPSICTKKGWNPLNFFSPPCALKYRCHKAITSTLNKTKILVHYHRGSCFVLDGNEPNAFEKKRCNHFPERGHLATLPGKQTVEILYDVFTPDWSKQGIHDFAYIGLKAEPYTWSGTRSEMWEHYNWYASDQEKIKAPGSAVKWASTEPGDANDLCGHLWRTQEYIYGYPCKQKIAQLCEYRDYDAIEFQPYKQGVRGLANATFNEHANTTSTACAELCRNNFLCQSYTHQQQNGLCSLHYLPASELWTKPLEGATLYDLAEFGCTCDPALLDAPTASYSATREDGQINRGQTATKTCPADEYAEIDSEKVRVQTIVCTSKGWNGTFYPCKLPIIDPETNRKVYDLVYILDQSGSVGQFGFDRQNDFLKIFSKKFPIKPEYSQTTMIKFSDWAVYEWTFDDYQNQDTAGVVDRINAIKYGKGTTKITSALIKAQKTIDAARRPRVVQTVLLLTDGKDTKSVPPPEVVAKELRDKSVEIFVIAIGSDVNMKQLEAITGDPARIYETKFEDLPNIADDIIQLITSS